MSSYVGSYLVYVYAIKYNLLINLSQQLCISEDDKMAYC